MDIPFYYDPTSLAHADALRNALAASLTADACRATKYGFDDDDDVRAAYEERLGAAMRELREATVETAGSMEEEEDERDGGVRAYATVPGGVEGGGGGGVVGEDVGVGRRRRWGMGVLRG